MLDASLYVDTVAGTRPVGVAKRPVGCSQTNVYKRGEQVVVRSWGTDLATTDVLSSDNVSAAHFSIAGRAGRDAELGRARHRGQPGVLLVERLDRPGDVSRSARRRSTSSSTLESGKTGTYDYTINVIP